MFTSYPYLFIYLIYINQCIIYIHGLVVEQSSRSSWCTITCPQSCEVDVFTTLGGGKYKCQCVSNPTEYHYESSKYDSSSSLTLVWVYPLASIGFTVIVMTIALMYRFRKGCFKNVPYPTVSTSHTIVNEDGTTETVTTKRELRPVTFRNGNYHVNTGVTTIVTNDSTGISRVLTPLEQQQLQQRQVQQMLGMAPIVAPSAVLACAASSSAPPSYQQAAAATTYPPGYQPSPTMSPQSLANYQMSPIYASQQQTPAQLQAQAQYAAYLQQQQLTPEQIAMMQAFAKQAYAPQQSEGIPMMPVATPAAAVYQPQPSPQQVSRITPFPPSHPPPNPHIEPLTPGTYAYPAPVVAATFVPLSLPPATNPDLRDRIDSSYQEPGCV